MNTLYVVKLTLCNNLSGIIIENFSPETFNVIKRGSPESYDNNQTCLTGAPSIPVIRLIVSSPEAVVAAWTSNKNKHQNMAGLKVALRPKKKSEK